MTEPTDDDATQGTTDPALGLHAAAILATEQWRLLAARTPRFPIPPELRGEGERDRT